MRPGLSPAEALRLASLTRGPAPSSLYREHQALSALRDHCDRSLPGHRGTLPTHLCLLPRDGYVGHLVPPRILSSQCLSEAPAIRTTREHFLPPPPLAQKRLFSNPKMTPVLHWTPATGQKSGGGATEIREWVQQNLGSKSGKNRPIALTEIKRHVWQKLDRGPGIKSESER